MTADGARPLTRGIRLVRERESNPHHVAAGSELGHRQPVHHRAPFPGTDARVQIPPLPGGRRWHAPGYDAAAILLLEPLTVDLHKKLLDRRSVVGQNAFHLALQVGLEEQRPASVPLRLRRVQPDLDVVAFALETSDGERRARAKLEAKGADWIVCNGPASLGSGRTTATILGADGSQVRLEDRTKADLARRLVALLGPS